MSSNQEALEQKFIDWGLSPNGFMIPLRSKNTFDENALIEGLDILKEYLEINKDCVSHRVLQLIAHIYYELNIALQRSMRTNNLERSEAILDASYQLRRVTSMI